jgi:hypothetical protein
VEIERESSKSHTIGPRFGRGCGSVVRQTTEFINHLKSDLGYLVGRDSVVGVATGYRLYGPVIESG